MKFPAGLAVDYYRELLGIVRQLQKNVEAAFPELESIFDHAATLQRDEKRLDALPTTELTRLLTRLRLRGQVSPQIAEQIARKLHGRMAQRVAKVLSADLRKALRKGLPREDLELSLGVSRAVTGAVTAQGKSLLNLIEQSFIPENVGLIRSIPERFHERVESIVWKGIQSGKLSKDIQKELRESFKISKSRAELIARDQSGKLFGDINRIRQKDAGLESFIWRTVKDERVRESHKALEGKVFSWAKGADGLFPGEDYQCRCVALPNPKELWGEEPEVAPLPAKTSPKEIAVKSRVAVPELPEEAQDIERWEDFMAGYVKTYMTEDLHQKELLDRTKLKHITLHGRIKDERGNDVMGLWDRHSEIMLSVDRTLFEEHVSRVSATKRQDKLDIANMVQRYGYSREDAESMVSTPQWFCLPEGQYTANELQQHVVRHEIGHAVLDGIYTRSWKWADVFPEVRDDTQIYDYIKANLYLQIRNTEALPGGIAENISRYAERGARNKNVADFEHEFFAEAWARYTARDYKEGDLPEEVENFLGRIAAVVHKGG